MAEQTRTLWIADLLTDVRFGSRMLPARRAARLDPAITLRV